MAYNGAKRHPEKTPIFVAGRSTPIGFVQGNVFCKWIQGSKHILRTPRAIAFDRSTLADAERAGAVFAQVTDDETKTVYRARIDAIWTHGFSVNRGYGSQIGLTLNRFDVNGKPAAATFESNKAIQAAQPSLFGGMGE
ncbi:MAG: hypothetical protein KJZ86_13735 [Caldilineaceae bacterium]|nr:hypothetical protein [Caldilineaceae bacterium]